MIFFFPSVPARITNISKDITVNEGSNVNLICLAVGRPEANIIWRHHSLRGNIFFCLLLVLKLFLIMEKSVSSRSSGVLVCNSQRLTRAKNPPDWQTKDFCLKKAARNKISVFFFFLRCLTNTLFFSPILSIYKYTCINSVFQ